MKPRTELCCQNWEIGFPILDDQKMFERISWSTGDPQCLTNLWLHTIRNPLLLNAKCADLPTYFHAPLTSFGNHRFLSFSSLIMFKPWALVRSAVRLLLRSLLLYSAGTREDEVYSQITRKSGKESKFWFKWLKSYVTLKPKNPRWNCLWWPSWFKNCIVST